MTQHHEVLDTPARTVEGCSLCAVIRGARPARFVHRYDDYIAIDYAQPQAPFHVLVLPTTHYPSPTAFVAEAGARVIGKLMRIAADCGAQFAPHGFRIVMNQGPDAGQTCPHIAVHVIGGQPLSPSLG